MRSVGGSRWAWGVAPAVALAVLAAAPAHAGFNEDTNLDAVFANAGDAGEDNRVCLGDGTGSLDDCSDVSADLNFSVGAALGDVDGDGNLDAVFANDDDPNRVCLGDGSGSLDDCSDVSADTNDSFGVALGDVDGDGHLDAVFANFGDENRVCLGDGSGSLDDCSNVSADTNAIGVALSDTDQDGVQDNEDVCVPSDLRTTVFIRGEDTGVDNDLTDTTVPTLFDSTLGCTVADLIEATAKLSASRAQFLRNLQLVLRALVLDGTLSFSDAQTLRAAAAAADLP